MCESVCVGLVVAFDMTINSMLMLTLSVSLSPGRDRRI